MASLCFVSCVVSLVFSLVACACSVFAVFVVVCEVSLSARVRILESNVANFNKSLREISWQSTFLHFIESFELDSTMRLDSIKSLEFALPKTRALLSLSLSRNHQVILKYLILYLHQNTLFHLVK
ncbi:hypothetical protein DCO58_02985 [Helicobacter saguini]|uniref:Uncharacterized protein n=1 Tax=Helicobacter saguini TaxID=1548018 RepID=A0A4U8T610_9HELI|nr:hypothetical protein [Helicobacter saguini]MWV62659.1 hypothetical protein [Helicobacter saguini]MWV66669.1 hypothetical protein [Helicobacter saguini]MWV69019.1 hypothetical protein [Helicobacter saguini]MWV71427.1 hypothetical protein [Helicobacter saguini]TLD94077.1 hypothetical protein LS64_007110 [Helicobacter saguini]